MCKNQWTKTESDRLGLIQSQCASAYLDLPEGHQEKSKRLRSYLISKEQKKAYDGNK